MNTKIAYAKLVHRFIDEIFAKIKSRKTCEISLLAKNLLESYSKSDLGSKDLSEKERILFNILFDSGFEIKDSELNEYTDEFIEFVIKHKHFQYLKNCKPRLLAQNLFYHTLLENENEYSEILPEAYRLLYAKFDYRFLELLNLKNEHEAFNIRYFEIYQNFKQYHLDQLYQYRQGLSPKMFENIILEVVTLSKFPLNLKLAKKRSSILRVLFGKEKRIPEFFKWWF